MIEEGVGHVFVPLEEVLVSVDLEGAVEHLQRCARRNQLCDLVVGYELAKPFCRTLRKVLRSPESILKDQARLTIEYVAVTPYKYNSSSGDDRRGHCRASPYKSNRFPCRFSSPPHPNSVKDLS